MSLANPRLVDGTQAPPTDSTVAIVRTRSRAARPARARGTGGRRLSATVLHVALIVAGVAMVFPFLWMLLTSFKTLPQLLQDPLSFWPEPWTFDNYVEAWNAVPFAQAYVNSIYIAVLAVVGTLLTASMAGYAFARISFRGSRVHLHRVPRDADDPQAGDADPVLPADGAARMGRLAPVAHRARRCS